jgi:hypothetical protein
MSHELADEGVGQIAPLVGVGTDLDRLNDGEKNSW